MLTDCRACGCLIDARDGPLCTNCRDRKTKRLRVVRSPVAERLRAEQSDAERGRKIGTATSPDTVALEV